MRLEPFSDEHLPAVEALIAEPLGAAPHPHPGAATARVRARLARAATEANSRVDGVAEIFAVLDDDDTPSSGSQWPLRSTPPEREAELGYMIALAAARGRGVATEALIRLTRWAFDELGLQRLTLVISARQHRV